MNHEAESAPLIPEGSPYQITEEQQVKVVSINKLLFNNASQAFTPGMMISKNIYVFARTIKKSFESYKNSGKIQFTQNISKSLEEFDGVSYSNETLNNDQSVTAKGFRLFGKLFSKISKIFGRTEEQQEQQGNQQQNRNESLIPEQSQRQDLEQQ